jgi:hypothetical protein
MKGFPREKNCVIMAKNEKCEISLDENKNISMDNIASPGQCIVITMMTNLKIFVGIFY